MIDASNLLLVKVFISKLLCLTVDVCGKSWSFGSFVRVAFKGILLRVFYYYTEETMDLENTGRVEIVSHNLVHMIFSRVSFVLPTEVQTRIGITHQVSSGLKINRS